MIKIIKGNDNNKNEIIDKLRQRSTEINEEVEISVKNIIDEVRENKDKAIVDFTEKFDGKAPQKMEVTKEEIEKAYESCDKDFISALEKAAVNIREFHQRQKQQSFITTREDGVIMGQRIRGLNRVGIYVPGGTAAYPSSVLMNAIPAKIAGVKEIVMVTPPMKDGTANKNILASAKVAGVDRVFLVGGAQAVAGLAFGTETIPKVDKIVGPGNIFVATAKKQLYGTVDIDMIAGPSEILIIADESAKPKYLAADFLSQAEHDKLASSILITTSEKIANDTIDEIYKQLKQLPREEIATASVEDFGAVIVCDNVDSAVNFANELAPEHLEVCLNNPFEYLGRLDNAGSVFLGNYSPEPLGDYFAGPNHVLPTSGTARFFSPLSVDSFIKKSSYIYYTKKALNEVSSDIIKIAQTEGLDAHANSIRVRN